MRQLAPHVHPGLHLHHIHKFDLAHVGVDTVKVYDQSLAAGKTIQNCLTQVLNSVRQSHLKQKEC